MYQKILVPVDGSDPSNFGVLAAIMLAQNQRASIRLLHVVDKHVLDLGYCIETYPGDRIETLRDAANKVVHDSAALVRQFGLEAETVSMEARSGDVAVLIAAQAKSWGADLIVMGTHGRHGLRRLALGSNAETVVRDTTIPVLLVHNGSANTLNT
jgi:nucleotide-binding universal stress UspA family protein